MLTIQDLRGMSDKELADELKKVQKKLMELRMKKSIGQLKETHEITACKIAVARIKTLQTQTTLQGMKSAAE